MQLFSRAFKNMGIIPEKYTCDGANINPPLSFQDIPPHTESLALIMVDFDVPPTIHPEGIWVHWMIWDIPPEIRKMAEGETSVGTEGLNSSGSVGYIGPCPPDKEHRYFFRLYALNNVLNISLDSNKNDLEDAMDGHIIGQTELMGRYARKK